MARLLHIMLLASTVNAAALQGYPTMLSTIEDKIKPWATGSNYIPDGKFFMMRKDPNDDNAGFIINAVPNTVFLSTSSSITDYIGEYNEGAVAKKEGFLLSPENVSIAPASETGMRGNGSNYDECSNWIFNAFRLSETSQPGADSNNLIGFEHNEDYWEDLNGGHASKCTYKSIGVRYSSDLGITWTRSAPIITKGIQTATCNINDPFTGTGDFATMWNPNKKEWVIIAQEGPLVMSTSTDPLAKPGSWSRIDPVSGKTAPGFRGDGTAPLSHGDLVSISGSNPSIIYDSKNAVYHMAYAKWGGGIAYTKSVDLYRWDIPYIIWENADETPHEQYPTLVGDGGDTLTTDGTATLYFTAGNKVGWGRPVWSVGIDLSANFTASGEGS